MLVSPATQLDSHSHGFEDEAAMTTTTHGSLSFLVSSRTPSFRLAVEFPLDRSLNVSEDRVSLVTLGLGLRVAEGACPEFQDAEGAWNFRPGFPRCCGLGRPGCRSLELRNITYDGQKWLEGPNGRRLRMVARSLEVQGSIHTCKESRQLRNLKQSPPRVSLVMIFLCVRMHRRGGLSRSQHHRAQSL